MVILLIASAAGSLSAQIDAQATVKTKVLYQNLKHIQNTNQFLFGQEFFNSFRYSSGSAHGDEEYSDSKVVTGAHPALLGSDFHYYLEKDATERGYHTEAVKWAFQHGYAITFDWHISARGTTSYRYSDQSKNLANNIVNNLNGDREWLFSELDKVIAIINNDLVVNGENIPIVFRPWHEMNGGWFWWGSTAMTATSYIELYKLTVNYIKERTNSVLFCWSPNTPATFTTYPGNDYVDVVGLDIYEATATSLRKELGAIVDHAQANDKVAVLSETGNRSDNGDQASFYWKNTILPAILDDPTGKIKKIAWVLTWINASWSKQYVPHSNSSQAAKQSFIDFKNSTNVLFGDEIPNLYMEIPIVPVAAEEKITDDVDIFPIPANKVLSLSVHNFQSPKVQIIDTQGKAIYETQPQEKNITISLEGLTKPGVYFLIITDSVRSVRKKLVIN